MHFRFQTNIICSLCVKPLFRAWGALYLAERRASFQTIYKPNREPLTLLGHHQHYGRISKSLCNLQKRRPSAASSPRTSQIVQCTSPVHHGGFRARSVQGPSCCQPGPVRVCTQVQDGLQAVFLQTQRFWTASSRHSSLHHSCSTIFFSLPVKVRRRQCAESRLFVRPHIPDH